MCARPGCQSPAAAWLTYDYGAQRVWLDDAGAGDGGNRWALCASHATGLRAPKGWAQVDRRVGRPASWGQSRYEPPTALVG